MISHVRIDDKTTEPYDHGTSSKSSTMSSNETKKFFYQSGFGNTWESECIPDALPKGRNNPRQVPYNLYTEQLSGTAFTVPRAINRRVWMYRIQPSVVIRPMKNGAISVGTDTAPAKTTAADHPIVWFGGTDPRTCQAPLEPLRWKPMPSTGVQGSSSLEGPESSPSSRTDQPNVSQYENTNKNDHDFVTGMRLMCCTGDVRTKSGLAIYMYSCTQSMMCKQQNGNDGTTTTTTNNRSRYLYNCDGDFLIVPQLGTLQINTELGRFHVAPTEIIVIPRGIVFQVNLLEETDNSSSICSGYVLEVYKSGGFQLPELGPIGSNGLANARDFLYPTAWCIMDPIQYKQSCHILYKTQSQIHVKESDHSPFNVVAWHGNYLPYKYDLKQFCAINSVTYDHMDPSIYTVLTCPSEQPGTALADFVIFPPRYMATDSNTFRPPWFHRNTMSEFMGLIQGSYDAKVGFMVGGATLHNCMFPHGPDSTTYNRAIVDSCENPTKFDGGLAFMFETYLPLQVSPLALHDVDWLDSQYMDCWQDLTDQFTGWNLFAQQQQEKQDGTTE